MLDARKSGGRFRTMCVCTHILSVNIIYISYSRHIYIYIIYIYIYMYIVWVFSLLFPMFFIVFCWPTGTSRDQQGAVANREQQGAIQIKMGQQVAIVANRKHQKLIVANRSQLGHKCIHIYVYMYVVCGCFLLTDIADISQWLGIPQQLNLVHEPGHACHLFASTGALNSIFSREQAVCGAEFNIQQKIDCLRRCSWR